MSASSPGNRSARAPPSVVEYAERSSYVAITKAYSVTDVTTPAVLLDADVERSHPQQPVGDVDELEVAEADP